MIQFIKDIFTGFKFGAIRSPKWSEVRKKHLEKNPLCAVCGRKSSFLNSNEVHHIKPFHLYPKLELSPKNLITLCRPHHLLFGHLMSWKSYNILVDKDSFLWKKKIETRK